MTQAAPASRPPPEPAADFPFRRANDPALPSAQAEFRMVQEFLKDTGQQEAFRALERPVAAISLAWVARSWGLVFAAAAAVSWHSVWWTPAALVLIASCQRSLGNNLHDSAHGNIFRRSRSWVWQWLFAAPLLEDFRQYQRTHLLHHAWLGVPDQDPDFMVLRRRFGNSAPGLYFDAFFSGRRYWDHCVGELVRMRWAARFKVLAFWLLLPALCWAAAGGAFTLTLVALWFTARHTTYWALKVFTELTDHVGLQPGSILSFTRNAPRNVFSWLVHPHDDNYHLTHHMAPRVPMVHLRRTHALLLGIPAYAAGYHCDGYFAGRYPVTASWTGAAPPHMEAAATPESLVTRLEPGSGG